MNKLMVRISILCALITGTFITLAIIPTPYDSHLAAILNKRDLLKSQAEQRIIFIGGSGLLSLDSVMIQGNCSGCEVINMGLYFGFGITPLLDTVRPYLRRNDIIMIMPEYDVIFDNYTEQTRQWIFALDPVRNLTKLYGRSAADGELFFKDVFRLFKIKVNTYSQALKEVRRTNNWQEFFTAGQLNYRMSYNRHGDLLILKPSYAKDKLQDGNMDLSKPYYQNQSFEALNEFSRFAAEKGAKIYFTFPAYPDGEYDLNRQAIDQFHQRLKNELTIPVLGKPKDFIFPYRFFSDTVNHLTKEGRKLRSEKLIILMKNAGILPGHMVWAGLDDTKTHLQGAACLALKIASRGRLIHNDTVKNK